MLNIENEIVKTKLFCGNIGLEREGIRIDESGQISTRPHPFDKQSNIDRDFAESQIELVTEPSDSVLGACTLLKKKTEFAVEYLEQLEPKEKIYRFSVPPKIRDIERVKVAHFFGKEAEKTSYRKYLQKKYGRYQQLFSGVHFNYSFSDELLQSSYESVDDPGSFLEYKNYIYLELAKKLVLKGWLIVALMQASPIVDETFGEEELKSKFSRSARIKDEVIKFEERVVFTGKGSIRCSDLGYWNTFIPILNYSDLSSYAASIQKYVDEGLIVQFAELYYPYRIKSGGSYGFEELYQNGAEYIELRLIDVNPYELCGISREDALFLQIFLVWLAATKDMELDDSIQEQAVQNHKIAAGFDLDHCFITDENRNVKSVSEAGIEMLDEMEKFFENLNKEESDHWIKEILEFQKSKLTDYQNRYSYKICKENSVCCEKK